MENDDKAKELINSKTDADNIFIQDYENQNIENNNKFIKWKELMNQKYPNNGRLYKCPFEKLFFYEERKDGYNVICPSCKKSLCCFCLKPVIEAWYAKCCITRKLYIMHYQGVTFSELEERKNSHFYDYEKETISFLIPIINFSFFIAILYNAFLFKISSEHYDENNNENISYFEYYKTKSVVRLIIFMVIIGITALVLLIPFFIFDVAISIMLLILLIIRTKWYMYLIGLFHEDWYFLKKNIYKIC